MKCDAEKQEINSFCYILTTNNDNKIMASFKFVFEPEV